MKCTFKIGQKVKIIKNTSSHHFEIGQFVQISEIKRGSNNKCIDVYQCTELKAPYSTWSVIKSDIELVKQKVMPFQKRKRIK